jgi:Flp pilus assembly protein TadD
MPERARVRYNAALALQKVGKPREAEAAFVKAQKVAPDDPEIAYALTVLYVQERDWRRARAAAERLATLAPGNSQAQELLRRVPDDQSTRAAP